MSKTNENENLQSILYIMLIIFIVLPVFFLFLYKLAPHKERFELTSRPCISRQLQLLNRVTELLINTPNSVPLQKYQWELWHGNLSTAQLDAIEKKLP